MKSCCFANLFDVLVAVVVAVVRLLRLLDR